MQKNFCNTIGTKPTCHLILRMSDYERLNGLSADIASGQFMTRPQGLCLIVKPRAVHPNIGPGPAAQTDNMNNPGTTNSNSDAMQKSATTGASSGMSSGSGSATTTTGGANGTPNSMPKQRPDRLVPRRRTSHPPSNKRDAPQKTCGALARLSHIFFGFIEVIFIALFMCIEHPAISFCDIEDFAEVISCIAIVLFSPSGIFIIMPSAFAMLASEQPIIFDLADAGAAAIVTTVTNAAKANLEFMFVPRNESRHYCRHEEHAC
jgi:hypothetical protein